MTGIRNSRTVRRITLSDRNDGHRQAVVRTPSGGIDYEFYFKQAKRRRSEAYVRVFDSLVQMAKGLFRPSKTKHAGKGTAKCDGGCTASG